MRRVLLVALAFSFAATKVWPVTAQDTRNIVGTWKVLDVVRKEMAGDTIDKPYGNKPMGYYVFTAGGHFYWNLVADNRNPPAGPAPTDVERIELFNTLSFGTGTYKTEGGWLHLHYDSSWIQSWTGTRRSVAMPAFAGRTMTIKSAPFKDPIRGVDAMTISIFERVE